MMTISNDLGTFHVPNWQKQILGMFETGLASSLTFLPHTRMGKTDFLQKRYYAP